MLEVIASTRADGITQNLDPSPYEGLEEEPLAHDLEDGRSIRDEKYSGDGSQTPRASKALFDDSFGENFEEVNLEPDAIGIRQSTHTHLLSIPSNDPFTQSEPSMTLEDEVPKSHAMAALERSFGSVSLDEAQQGNLLDAFNPDVRSPQRSSSNTTPHIKEDKKRRFSSRHFSSSH